MIRTNNSIVTGRIRSRRIISAVVTVNSDPDGVLDGGPGDMAVDTVRNWLYVKTTPLGQTSGWVFLAGPQDTGWRGWDLGGGWNVLVPGEGTYTLAIHLAYRRISDSVLLGIAFKITSQTGASLPGAGSTIGPSAPVGFPSLELTAGTGSGDLYEAGGVRATAQWKVPWEDDASPPQVLLGIDDGGALQVDAWYWISSSRLLTDMDFPEAAAYGGQAYTPPSFTTDPVFG